MGLMPKINHSQLKNPKHPQPKKRKRKEAKKKTTFEDDEDDENYANDNRFDMDDDDEDQAEKSDHDQNKHTISPYEVLRTTNTAERELFMRSAGLLPHSKIIKIW